jgi:DNA-binding phage protein
MMALTRDFKQTIQARAERDPAFRRELLKEGIATFLAGDIETGKTILRDYVNATIGFERLAEVTGVPAKSLMRMLGPAGNPTARHIFEVIGYLQEQEGIRFEIRSRRAS